MLKRCLFSMLSLESAANVCYADTTVITNRTYGQRESLAMLDGIDTFAGLIRGAFTMLDRIDALTRI